MKRGAHGDGVDAVLHDVDPTLEGGDLEEAEQRPVQRVERAVAVLPRPAEVVAVEDVHRLGVGWWEGVSVRMCVGARVCVCVDVCGCK